MKGFACFAFAFLFVEFSYTEAGLFKKIINNIAGSGNSSQNEDYRSPSGSNHVGNHEHGSSRPNNEYSAGSYGNKPGFQVSFGGFEGTSTQNHGHGQSENIQSQSFGSYNNRPGTQGGVNNHGNTHGSQGNVNQNQSYKNTSWYIENEDYLSPNENTSNKGTGGKIPGGHGSSDKHRPRVNEDIMKEHENQTKTESPVEETPEEVTLRSDSIICRYSNVREEKIENRKMTCNDTECVLEKNSEKSSLWICKDIKCNVANVDFTQVQDNKKLLECSMDGRNIITVQNKPLKCGPNEKEHNGRCRTVFGA